MNSNPENFETLRKLMALKRHEQPPPEYLHRLSDTIITRIERGEGRQNLWDKVSANFSLRPSLAYAFGLTVCGALGLSAVYMVRQEMIQSGDAAANFGLRSPAPSLALANPFETTTPQLHVANWMRNTNPTVDLQPELPLFRTSSHVAVPVSYSTGN